MKFLTKGQALVTLSFSKISEIKVIILLSGLEAIYRVEGAV